MFVLDPIRKAGRGGGLLSVGPDTKSGEGGGGCCPLHARCEKRVGEGGAVCFRSDTKNGGGGGGGGGGCLPYDDLRLCARA